MTDQEPPPLGFLTSARELLDGLVGTIEDRLALFANEFQEEKFRLIRSFVWIGAAFFTGMVALLFVSLTVIYLCEGRARLIALGVLSALYLAAFIAIALGARRYFARESRPFEDTLRELARDRACIRPEN